MARLVSYPQWLGHLGGGFLSEDRPVIAVAGTHGKSSVVASLGQLLPDYGVVGGIEVAGRSGRAGDVSCPIIVEACEYRRHFLSLAPSRLATEKEEGRKTLSRREINAGTE